MDVIQTQFYTVCTCECNKQRITKLLYMYTEIVVQKLLYIRHGRPIAFNQYHVSIKQQRPEKLTLAKRGMTLELRFDVEHHSVVVILYKYMIINSRQVNEFSIVYCATEFTRTAPQQSICELLRVTAIPGRTRLHDNQKQNKRKLIRVLLCTIQVQYGRSDHI